MMSTQPSHTPLPFGLLELDKAGIVIRYSPAAETNSEVRAREILGRNFFHDVIPVAEVEELQNRFSAFTAGTKTIDKFTGVFSSGQGPIKAQIMLAYLSVKPEHGREFLALVRLMPEDANALMSDGNREQPE